MSDWVDVAKTIDFPENSRRIVDIDDVMVAVFNLDGEYYALEDLCTHDYASLDDACVEGCEIICPRHAARFNIKTGEALTPPAYEAITTFPVRIHNDIVQIRDPRWD